MNDDIMRLSWLAHSTLFLASSFACVASTPSQTPLDPSATLRSALTQNYLVLRDYSNDPAITYRYNTDGTLGSVSPGSQIFSAIKIDSVKVSDHQVRLEGKRFFAVLNSSSHSLELTNPAWAISIKVEFAPAERQAMLNKLAQLLFFGSLREAIGSVPGAVAHDVPATFDNTAKKYVPCNPCNRGKDDGSDIAMATDAGMTPPKLIKQVDPVIPNDLAVGASAESLIATVIETDGMTKDFWVLHSAGGPVDAAALVAVQQYRFAPALKDGKPVRVMLHIAVHMEKR